MGVDFIRRCTPTFTKSWNHGRDDLAIPTLFTRTPGSQARSLVAECSDIGQLKSGSEITIVSDGESLVTLNGTRPVGRVKSVPPDILKCISDAGGITIGTVGELHPVSETFDVRLP